VSAASPTIMLTVTSKGMALTLPLITVALRTPQILITTPPAEIKIRIQAAPEVEREITAQKRITTEMIEQSKLVREAASSTTTTLAEKSMSPNASNEFTVAGKFVGFQLAKV
jgi:hypothetical protein